MTAKQELFNILDAIGEQLDITPTQFNNAKDRYEAVGKHLAEGEYCLINKKICLKNGEIYPQGSIRLGTTVKPLGLNEFDVDLVFFTPNISTDDIDPTELNRLIGNRLRESETYKKMMEPLKRGWRIIYHDEFYLDITPSIENHTEPYNKSELVPDRKIQNWKSSNPKEYAEIFDATALKSPYFSITKSIIENRASTVSDFPENIPKKPLLKRYVQLFKRHRDVMFENKNHAPISVIITTLAMHSYAYCIANFEYDNEYDLLLAVLDHMPAFIQKENGKYKIMNPTTEHENFAERWNEVPQKKDAFDEWHKEVTKFFNRFHENMGQHRVFEVLEDGFGKKPISNIANQYTANITQRRNIGLLATSALEVPVKSNTFFGKNVL